MPTYEYRCNKCEQHFEVFQSFSEEPLKKHPGCGGKVVKVLSPAGIVFSGSGFYKTDNRSAAKRSNSGNGGDSGSGPGESKSGESKSGETKSGETKSGETKSGETKKSESKSSETKKSA